MKLARVLWRLVLLSVAAAAFVGLTEFYGRSTQLPLPNPGWQEEHGHRRSAPEIGYFSEFIGFGMLLAIIAVAGRLVFRLRLNPAPSSEGRSIVLDLHRGRLDSFKHLPARAGPTPSSG